MTVSLSFSLLLLSFISLTSCYKKPEDRIKDIEVKIQADQKKNDELIKLIEKSFGDGGQPGNIKISGAIVKDNALLDQRITATAKGGIGKDNVEQPVLEKYKVQLSSRVGEIDLSKLTLDVSLMSAGCDQEKVLKFAAERSLEIKKIPASVTKDVRIIQANTVILCGNLEEIKLPYLSIEADAIILDGVDYNYVNSMGWINLNANKLTLIGSNKIRTRGLDSNMVLLISPSIELNVVAEISSQDEGKLAISSVGGSYKK